jgi:hypothetical protein
VTFLRRHSCIPYCCGTYPRLTATTEEFRYVVPRMTILYAGKLARVDPEKFQTTKPTCCARLTTEWTGHNSAPSSSEVCFNILSRIGLRHEVIGVLEPLADGNTKRWHVMIARDDGRSLTPLFKLGIQML